MPYASPAFADIYGLAPLVIIGGDAHHAARRSAVVSARDDYVKTLGRSTSEQHQPPHTLQSAPDPGCNLTRPGVYSLRWQHSVPAKSFQNPQHCAYYGHLQPVAEGELRDFWDAAIYS